jgi:hypothetical protein
MEHLRGQYSLNFIFIYFNYPLLINFLLIHFKLLDSMYLIGLTPKVDAEFVGPDYLIFKMYYF